MVPAIGRGLDGSNAAAGLCQGNLAHLTRKCISAPPGPQRTIWLFSFRSRPAKGGLAQLVERLLCKQNVNGSNPLTSTISKFAAIQVSVFSDKTGSLEPDTSNYHPGL
jgi:hypothetical protein